jgi:hypothetical protein
MTIEDALRTMHDRLAALRLFADALAQTDDTNPAALSGLGDMLEDVQTLAAHVKGTLPVSVLAVETPRSAP